MLRAGLIRPLPQPLAEQAGRLGDSGGVMTARPGDPRRRPARPHLRPGGQAARRPAAGEGGTLGPAAALAGAVAGALGAEVTKLPITPAAVWEALR